VGGRGAVGGSAAAITRILITILSLCIYTQLARTHWHTHTLRESHDTYARTPYTHTHTHWLNLTPLLNLIIALLALAYTHTPAQARLAHTYTRPFAFITNTIPVAIANRTCLSPLLRLDSRLPILISIAIPIRFLLAALRAQHCKHLIVNGIDCTHCNCCTAAAHFFFETKKTSF